MPNETPIFDEALLEAAENDESTEVGSEFDPDADYAAPPPPLPDGWYQARPILIGAKNAEGTLQMFVGPRPWGNIPATYFTQINAQIVDPGGAQDGKMTDRYNVTTHEEGERRYHTSSANLVHRALTNKPVPGSKQGTHMAAVVKELQNAPLVWIKTQLEGEAADASQKYNEAKKSMTPAELKNSGLKKPKTFRGEKAFTENGKLTGRAWDKDANEYVVGRPAIVDIKHISYEPPVK